MSKADEIINVIKEAINELDDIPRYMIEIKMKDDIFDYLVEEAQGEIHLLKKLKNDIPALKNFISVKIEKVNDIEIAIEVIV